MCFLDLIYLILYVSSICACLNRGRGGMNILPHTEMNGAGGHQFFYSVCPVVDPGVQLRLKAGRQALLSTESYFLPLLFWGGVVLLLVFELESLEET